MRQGRKSKEKRRNYRIKQLKKRKGKENDKGGIAGYTMAMNRYRANEVIDAASKMAVIAMTKQTTPFAVDHADIGLADGEIAGSGCILSVREAPQHAQQGIVQTAGCHKDVITAIKSIAGTKYVGGDTDGAAGAFRFDGTAAAQGDIAAGDEDQEGGEDGEDGTV